MIGPKSSANLGDVRPTERFVEYRGLGDQKWVLSDCNLDIITIIDAYADEYGPAAAIRSSPDKASAIRNLDWNRTHRTWNSDREVWEIDLNSIEYSIDKFTDQNYTVRVSEPMVRLAGLDAPERPYPVRPIWKLPTLKLNSYEKQPSATSLLLIPGIGPSKARSLLYGGFMSIPEVAHASVSEISKTDGFGEIFSQIAKYGAEAAIGQREPAAVLLAKKTTLSIPDAQKRIVALANRGVPQTEAISTLIDVYNSDLSEMESIFWRKLYSLYRDGYHSIEDVADSEVSDLTKLEYINKSQAKKIHDEALKLML